jgi:hypothetical protein
MIATLVRSIFEQPDRDATWSQLGDVIDKLTVAGFADAASYILAEQTDEWAIAKRYMSVESLKIPALDRTPPGDSWPAIDAAAGAVTR